MTYTHLPRHSWMQENNNAKWKEAVHAYLACVRWTDEQLGRVLRALDASSHADNTIIVFYSDHGFHLGEKLRWSKVSLWERSTRVPLIISVPGGLKDRRCARAVELLSIYPTLIELCGLCGGPDELEGVSLKPLLGNPEAEWDHPAITTLMRNNHTVRDERWRYIRYADGTEELYDHENDPNEWANLANSPDLTEVLARLKKHLPKVNIEQFSAVIRSQNKPRSRKTAWDSQEDWNRDKASVEWVFPFIDKNDNGKIDSEEYQAIQDYKKKHADWQDRARKELGIKPAQGN